MPRVPTPPSLSRASSTSSVSSVDTAFTSQTLRAKTADAHGAEGDAARRTRRRFTNVQLMLLEQLYHETSHPSREQRDKVAASGTMELRSVTVWFQNKRQTERKCKSDASDGAEPKPAVFRPAFTKTALPLPVITYAPRVLGVSAQLNRSASVGTTSSTHSFSTTSTFASASSATSKRGAGVRSASLLSLDFVASRTERALPRTPLRPRSAAAVAGPGPAASIWDLMPSSPPTPAFDTAPRDTTHTNVHGFALASPEVARPFIEFGKRSRSAQTLEWACAAARLGAGNREQGLTPVAKTKARAPPLKGMWPREEEREMVELNIDEIVDGDDTDVEEHEAITPKGSVVGPSGLWPVSAAGSVGAERKERTVVHDEETMRAALALCGLGRMR